MKTAEKERKRKMAREISERTKAAVLAALEVAIIDYREHSNNNEISQSLRRQFARQLSDAEFAHAELLGHDW